MMQAKMFCLQYACQYKQTWKSQFVAFFFVLLLMLDSYQRQIGDTTNGSDSNKQDANQKQIAVMHMFMGKLSYSDELVSRGWQPSLI